MDKGVSNRQEIQNTVVAVGTVFREVDILLGVSEGTILALMMFVMMIYDTDNEV